MSNRARYGLQIDFTATGVAVVERALGRIDRSLVRVGRSGRGARNDLGLIDRQLRAFGTTLRYAFAGSVTFGIINQARAMGEYYDQLSRVVGLLPQATNINKFAADLSRQGVEAGVGFDQIAQGARSLLQVLPDLKGAPASFVSDLTGELAKAAPLLESSVDVLAAGVGASLQGAGPGAIFDPKQWAAELARTYKLVSATQFSGTDVATYLGQLRPFARIGNISNPELFSFLEIMAKGGGTFAINQRHFRRLITEITSPSAQTAGKLEDIGLNTKTRGELLSTPGGFLQTLKTIFAEVDKRGGLAITSSDITEEQLAAAEEMLAEGNSQAAAAAAGVSGEGVTFLLDLLGRVESTRALATIYAQFKQDPGVFQNLRKEYADITTMTETFNEQVKRALDLRFIQTMTEQMAAFRRAVFEEFEPATRMITGALQGLFAEAEKHPMESLGIAAGGILGILGISKLRGLFTRLKGSPLGGAAVAAVTPGAPTGDFTNPFFVWVMNPGVGGLPLTPGRRVPGGGGRPGGRVTTQEPVRGGGKLGRVLGRGAKFLGPLGAVASIAAIGAFPDDASAPMLPGLQRLWEANPKAAKAFMGGNPAAWNKIVAAYNNAQNERRKAQRSPAEALQMQAMVAASAVKGTPFEGVLRAIETAARVSQISGGKEGKLSATVRVKLEPTGAAAALVKPATAEVHVPPSAWQGGAIPTSRGKTKSPRNER